MPVLRSATQRIWLTGLAASGATVTVGVSIFLYIVNLPDAVLPLRDPTPLNVAVTLALTGCVALLVTVIGNSFARTLAQQRRRTRLAWLRALIVDDALEKIQARRLHERTHATPAPPPPAPLGLSDEERTELAADWLRYLGFAIEIDALRGRTVDIHTEQLVARVVGEQEDAKRAMRQAARARVDQGRIAAVFLPDTPPAPLLTAACQAELAVLVMSPEEGSLIGLNEQAMDVLGIGREAPSAAKV